VNKTVPLVPTRDSGLTETKAYLTHLLDSGETVTVRTLIGFWGYRGRGKNIVEVINRDLVQMRLAVEPPLDSVPLDFELSLTTIPSDVRIQAAEEQPEDHLLPLSRINSATHALKADQPPGDRGYVVLGASVAEAVTVMMRQDFSQLPVVESQAQRTVIGVFSWESFAHAGLRGIAPRIVDDALAPVTTVDLHSDLFASIAPVADKGHVVVTYRGVLAGIVTASDLTLEFEDLTLPFLAVGRCERELKRVAASVFAEPLAAEGKALEEMTFGNLQHLYRRHWNKLGWALSKDDFILWLDATRRLRNAVAHFDDRDQDRSADVEAVHRLTLWLNGVKTAELDEVQEATKAN